VIEEQGYPRIKRNKREEKIRKEKKRKRKVLVVKKNDTTFPDIPILTTYLV